MSNFTRAASLLLIFFSAAVVGLAQEKEQPKKKKKEKPFATGSIITERLPAEYDPAAWKEYKSVVGRFSILFPGTPQEEIEKVKSDGREIVIRLLKLQALAAYAVMYLDDPAHPAGNSEATWKRLDFSVNQAIQMFQAVALQQKEITLDRHPGRFLMLRLPDGLVMRLRFYSFPN